MDSNLPEVVAATGDTILEEDGSDEFEAVNHEEKGMFIEVEVEPAHAQAGVLPGIRYLCNG